MRGMNTLPMASPLNESNPFAGGGYQEVSNPFATTPIRSESWPAANPFLSESQVGNNPFAPNPFAASESAITANPFGAQESPFAQPVSEWSQDTSRTSRLGERLQEKARPVMELGRRAVSSIVRLAPRLTDRLKQAYKSDYGQKITGMARDAATETAMTAAHAGARTFGERFGISYEGGELSVKKTKLARAAIRFALNPYGESVKAAKAAGKEAYRAGKQEARGQLRAAGATVANDAFAYAQSRYF